MGFDKHTTVHVRNLDPSLTEKIVGDVKRIVLATDRETQKSRGYAFVEFPMALLADECIRKCNGTSLKSKTIAVSPYSDKKEKKEPIKFEKRKKEEHTSQLDKDDPFYVSSSDEDEDEDKPNKDGIFPNRVLVVSKLSKNQSWEATMESLQTKFSKIGKVSNIRMPKQGSYHKGYAFIEFRKSKHAKRALEWAKKNTKLSVAWKIDRDQYVKKKQDAYIKKKEDEFDAEQERFQKHLKKYSEGEDQEDIEEPEEYFGEHEEEENKKEKDFDELLEDDNEKQEATDEDDIDEESESMMSDEEDGEDGGETHDDVTSEPHISNDDETDEATTDVDSQKEKKNDVQTAADLKKTIFVQNLPFQAGVDEIKELFENHYGPLAYVAIVAKSDGLSSGKAFIKFKRFSDAKRCIREAEKNMIQNPNAQEVDHSQQQQQNRRKLLVARALPKRDAEDRKKKNEKKEDPRNLRLAKIGFIASNSAEAKDMPPDHLKKIQRNWAEKNEKLKNPIYHVSETRLAIQNMPKSWTEKDLKKLILEKVNYDQVLGPNKKPKLVQVKIAKEKDGKQSKGFGFVEFAKHDAALCALERLNNNPKILNPRIKDTKVATANRLIVEFAIENTMKLTILRRHQKKSHQSSDEPHRMATSTTDKKRSYTNDDNMKKRKRKDNNRGYSKKTKQQ
ncbi:hypothetical protein C9374_006887 [Naegleria lovaniensis]|uniref:RRM domain-containing protein n=1 Tax=Naegleria lovaniensis TaxID=51637 RepID=A0AA88H608_NAELO|nr:uncharacterized protein C9374_006887 [Naegleria lovaniensis]KAG2393356.1 hypothetical protein C9374_006887 [Naegleria lovaniensis]